MSSISALRKLSLASIPIGSPLDFALCHRSSTPIFAKGQSATSVHIRALKAANIEELYECQSEEDILTLVASSEKQALPVKQLPVDMPIPYNVYSSSNGFLLRKGGVLTHAQFQNLVDNSAEDVWVDVDLSRHALVTYQVEYTKLSVASLEQRMCAKNGLVVKADSSRLLQGIRLESRPSTEIASSQTMKIETIKETDGFLKALQSCKMIDVSSIHNVSQSLQQGLHSDVNLSLGTFLSGDSNMLKFAQHSSKVATLSMAVGLALGYNDTDLKDLGLAALIHEIGMMTLPHQLMNKKDPLSDSEISYMRSHPVLAMDILRRSTEIPDRVILAVYQEHESPDRTGYPNQRPGHLIHDFSKIISLCDAYEAMTTPRPYRAAQLPYHAVEQLVKSTAIQKYDSRVMRALLQVIGLFPVGSWVKLSNNHYARVVANNPERYDKPVVSVLFDKTRQPLSIPEFINLSEKSTIQIVDVVSAEQFPGAELIGF